MSNYFSSQTQVDVFFHERLLDDAIAAVEKGAGYDLVERVMDAVVEHRPEWVIGVVRSRAEQIMDAGQSEYYYHAVSGNVPWPLR